MKGEDPVGEAKYFTEQEGGFTGKRRVLFDEGGQRLCCQLASREDWVRRQLTGIKPASSRTARVKATK